MHGEQKVQISPRFLERTARPSPDYDKVLKFNGGHPMNRARYALRLKLIRRGKSPFGENSIQRPALPRKGSNRHISRETKFWRQTEEYRERAPFGDQTIEKINEILTNLIERLWHVEVAQFS